MKETLQNNNPSPALKERLGFYVKKFNVRMDFLFKREKQIEKELKVIEEKQNETRLQKLRHFIDSQN